MKENGFNLSKERSRRYPTQTITNAEYADDMGLLANAPTQTETQLQEQASMSMHTKWNVCALIKQAASPQ